MGLRLLVCWDCGFGSRQGQGCLSLVSVVCCKVEVFATGRSLVQWSPTEYGVSECDRGTSTRRKPRPTRAVEPWEKNIYNHSSIYSAVRVANQPLIYQSIHYQSVNTSVQLVCQYSNNYPPIQWSIPYRCHAALWNYNIQLILLRKCQSANWDFSW